MLAEVDDGTINELSVRINDHQTKVLNILDNLNLPRIKQNL